MTARPAETPPSARRVVSFAGLRDLPLAAPLNDDYELLIGSGLYHSLIEARLLLPHVETRGDPTVDAAAARLLRPDPLPFLSYPYEWCFSQLKGAAQAVLRVAVLALKRGMILHDASASNVQWHEGRAILTDPLALSRYASGQPWPAYRQFCRHYLAPLALMSKVDLRLGQLLRVHLDGVPLDLASRLLPAQTRISPALAMHIHLHAAGEKHLRGGGVEAGRAAGIMRLTSLEALLDSLEAAVAGLECNPGRSEVSYEKQAYPGDVVQEAMRHAIAAMLARIAPRTVWDLNAGEMQYTRLALAGGGWALALDGDPASVERSFLALRASGERRILPLVIDPANPSPAQGWQHGENRSLAARGPAGATLALGLVHRLVLEEGVSLPQVAAFLAAISLHLLVDFVPGDDPALRHLAAARRDLADGYTEAEFVRGFTTEFAMMDRTPIPGSGRVLYRLKRRS